MKYSQPKFIFALQNIKPKSMQQYVNKILARLEDNVNIFHVTNEEPHVYIEFRRDFPNLFEIENHEDLKEIALIHFKSENNENELYEYSKEHFRVITEHIEL